MSEDTEEPKAIVSSNHGLDLVHPDLQPQTQFVLAHLAISGYLETGVPVDQPSAFAAGLERAGYAGPSDFWEAFLSEPVTIGDFIFFVSLRPSMPGVGAIKLTLLGLLKEAVRTKKPFILEDDLVEPRNAVRWLLSMGRRRSLIPVELAQHIEGANTKASEVAPRTVGAPDGYDWGAVKMVLMEECKSRGGGPRAHYPDLDWRKQSHAIKFVRERMTKTKEWDKDREPSNSTLKDRIARILKEIEAELADN